MGSNVWGGGGESSPWTHHVEYLIQFTRWGVTIYYFCNAGEGRVRSSRPTVWQQRQWLVEEIEEFCYIFAWRVSSVVALTQCDAADCTISNSQYPICDYRRNDSLSWPAEKTFWKISQSSSQMVFLKSKWSDFWLALYLPVMSLVWNKHCNQFTMSLILWNNQAEDIHMPPLFFKYS